MQLAKNTFTDATQDSGFEGIVRKFTDIYISIFQLEKKYTKEQIIEMYVNNKDLVGVVAGIGILQADRDYLYRKGQICREDLKGSI